MRIAHLLLLPQILLAVNTVNQMSVSMELSYILKCQNQRHGQGHTGAINNVYPAGGFSWIVPSEVAVVGYTLLELGQVAAAIQAADYLARVQLDDGAWANQYDETGPSSAARHTRHTVQPVMFLGALHSRGHRDYLSNLRKAHAWMVSRFDQSSGLMKGGVGEYGDEGDSFWLSDNAYLVIAWHRLGDFQRRDATVTAINQYFLHKAGSAWHPHLGPDLRPVSAPFGWIDFAPAMLDLAAFGVVYPAGLAERIQRELQLREGPDAGAVVERHAAPGQGKLMPGIGFQASLAWRDLGDLGTAAAASHQEWVEKRSGLWKTQEDEEEVTGGWVDWRDEAGPEAPDWQRFIDTSAYYLMVTKGIRFHHGLKEPILCLSDTAVSQCSPMQLELEDLPEGPQKLAFVSAASKKLPAVVVAQAPVVLATWGAFCCMPRFG